MTDNRQLIDLVSVGPATLADFKVLGITEVVHLIDKNALELFEQLRKLKGARVDPCCEDVFRAAIEQARDPKLSEEKCKWPYWSKIRKSRSGT